MTATTMSDSIEIYVTTADEHAQERSRSANVTLPLAAEELRKHMTSFVETLAPVIATAAKAGDCDGWLLDEVNLSAEISGSGQLSILGVVTAGGGGKGGINFKFKRTSAPQP